MRTASDNPYRHQCTLLHKAFGHDANSITDLGESTFGWLWDVTLPCPPHRVIVKVHKHPWRALRETRQLEVLRAHASTRVPEVYYHHQGTDDLPFEALVMEHIPGITAVKIGEADRETFERFTEEIAEILASWHSVRNPEGYGPLDGPYHPRWIDYYGPRVEETWEAIRTIEDLPNEVLEVAWDSMGQMGRILGNIGEEAALIHSDFWPGNILIDPQTCRVNGVIDPLDAEWADRELDLIFLAPQGGRSHILDAYLRRMPCPDGFELRQAFYQFWYSLYILARINWQEPEKVLARARRLDEAMRRQLPGG